MSKEGIDFGKLDKFSQLSDNTLTEISENDLLSGEGATGDTNIDEPAPGSPSPSGEGRDEVKPAFDVKREPGEGSTINLATFLKPEYAITAIDELLPLLFVYGLSAMKISIRKNQMQLTEKQKNDIMPLVEDCLKELNILIKSPFVALGLMLMIMYGSKAMEHGIRVKETKRAETDGKTPLAPKDSRGRKKGTTKEVIEERKKTEGAQTV